MRYAKRFACRADKIAFQRFFGREREGVQHQVEAVGLGADASEKCLDLIITRNVAGKERRLLSKFADELCDIFL